MEPKEQDHSAAIGPHSVDAQRPTKKKALSIAIRYNALFERSKDEQHLLKNAYKDLAIVREILSTFLWYCQCSSFLTNVYAYH